MKKPARAAGPVKGIVPPAAKAKAAQPGNAPGRGKAAHAKAGPKKPPPKPKVSAKVKAQRHATALKAAKTRAANVKKAKQHPKRQLALGEGVACCSAEALAASLRLTGWPVDDSDVLALYQATASTPDEGASLLVTLEMALASGLAGVKLRNFSPVDPEEVISGDRSPAGLMLGLALPAPHAVLDTGSEWITWGQAWPAWAFPDAELEEAWVIEWEG